MHSLTIWITISRGNGSDYLAWNQLDFPTGSSSIPPANVTQRIVTKGSEWWYTSEKTCLCLSLSPLPCPREWFHWTTICNPPQEMLSALLVNTDLTHTLKFNCICSCALSPGPRHCLCIAVLQTWGVSGLQLFPPVAPVLPSEPCAVSCTWCSQPSPSAPLVVYGPQL